MFKRLISPKMIVGIIKLMKIGINLTQAQQIIIIDSEYILYLKKQAEKSITRIELINYIIIYIFIC